MKAASGSVADVRALISSLKNERAAVETAAVPPDEAVPFVEETARRLLSGLSQYLALTDVVDAAAHGRQVDVRGLPSEQRLQLLVIALRPLVVGRFREELAAHYDSLTPGLPAAERRLRLDEIDAQLIALEKQEEELIGELAEAGVDVARRPDADPAAVLGL